MKLCKKCGVEKPRSEFHTRKDSKDRLRYECKECNKEKAKQWRVEHPEGAEEIRRRYCETKKYRETVRRNTAKHRLRYPEKVKARKAVTRATKNGRLIRQPCEVCDSTIVEAHHEDYSKPLDVRWFCHQHHREVHQRRPDAQNRRLDPSEG